jgi:hypothetical protein
MLSEYSMHHTVHKWLASELLHCSPTIRDLPAVQLLFSECTQRFQIAHPLPAPQR